jgi:hypothetical protein
MREMTEYIPILTTLFSVFFTIEIYKHYRYRRTKYLLWWTLGVITFGFGTLSESINVIFGWNEINLKFWYIVGALLGGFPLAQGSVYLLMSKKFARISTLFFVTAIIIASTFIIMTPITVPPDFDYRLTGAIFSWKWVRYFSPFINTYSLIFLVGGAVFSAWRYFKKGQKEALFIGNIFIAIGGLLPGIGGIFTRMGYVEVLFVTEILGLLLIYYGYRIIRNEKRQKAA